MLCTNPTGYRKELTTRCNTIAKIICNTKVVWERVLKNKPFITRVLSCALTTTFGKVGVALVPTDLVAALFIHELLLKIHSVALMLMEEMCICFVSCLTAVWEYDAESICMALPACAAVYDISMCQGGFN